MMKILKVLSIVLILIAEASTKSCHSKTFYATLSDKTVSVSNYSSNEDCTIDIRPVSQYSGSNYFLAIRWWTSFDVKGNMPDCNNDYVEVFLTSSYRTIGKYCSSNLEGSGLFNMFSHDGYARIKFKSDGSDTGSGFGFTFRMYYKKENYLGYLYQTYCRSITSYNYPDNVYSQGWPYRYEKSSSKCLLEEYIGDSSDTRIAFMDIDTSSDRICGYSNSDYVQLQGSNVVGSHNPTPISEKMCDTSSIKAFTVEKYSYIYIKATRLRGGPTHRGFVTGYVKYKSDKKTKTSNIIAIVLGIIAGVVVFSLVLGICIYKRRRNAGAILGQNRAKTDLQGTSNPNYSESTVVSQTIHPNYSATGTQSQYAPPQAPAPYPPPYGISS